MAGVWSVEQSSAIRSSQSPKVWACTDSMVSPIRRSTFQDGGMIETRGMPKDLPIPSAGLADGGSQRRGEDVMLLRVVDIELAGNGPAPRGLEIGRCRSGIERRRGKRLA